MSIDLLAFKVKLFIFLSVDLSISYIGFMALFTFLYVIKQLLIFLNILHLFHMGKSIDSIFIRAEIRFECEGTELITWVWSVFIVACLMLSIKVLIVIRFNGHRFLSRFILPFFLATWRSHAYFIKLSRSQHW